MDDADQTDTLCDMTISRLSAAIAAKDVSPVEVTEAALARIAAVDDRLHAFIAVTPDRARAAAKLAEREIMADGPRGAFHGIPYGLKDIIDVAGLVTTGHSKSRQAAPAATEDAEVAARLNAAGGILLGKLATFEFAIGGPSWDLPWPPARNPWNLERLPGGSSSGSGAAVAGRLCHAAVGTDTGGSVRWPAAVCGIVGLKPTYGRISRRGVMPNTFSLDHCGPMTRTVEDCAIMLGAMAGHDPRCLGSADVPVPDYRAALREDMTGLRIGYVRGWFEDEADADVIDAVDRAAEVFGQLGAVVTPLTLDPLRDYVDAKTVISMAELWSVHAPVMRARADEFGALFRCRVAPGAMIRGEDYLQAQRWRTQLTAKLLAQFTQFDLLLTAGWMTKAEAADPNGPDFFRKRNLVTMPFSLAGVPAISVPCGFSADGLPLALQLGGRPFDEAGVLAAAHAYERASPWAARRPALD
jgi:aspartyl-tRNA(Asn)/glutamyl-tRNA(Gln) amidotransferase subunit A